jgi:hypothetical protein
VAPRLFIATPTADGIVLAGYVAALARLLTRLPGEGIAAEYHTLDGDNLILQRNRLVQSFLASKGTHLLFIDSDMDFPPDLAERLLAFDKPVVGTVYPKRAMDLPRLAEQLKTMPFDAALARTYSWNLRTLADKVSVTRGFCRVEGLGGGFLLIRRDCFEELLARGHVPLYAGSDHLRAFFRETREGDDMLDLDYSFCRTWIGCGGEVWAHADADIGHIGDFRTGMSFLGRLKGDPGADAAPAPRRP